MAFHVSLTFDSKRNFRERMLRDVTNTYFQHYPSLACSIELHCNSKQLKKEKYISEKTAKSTKFRLSAFQPAIKNVSQLDDCTTKRRFYDFCSSDSLKNNKASLEKSQNLGYLLKKEQLFARGKCAGRDKVVGSSGAAYMVGSSQNC